MELDRLACDRARRSRDPRFDGRFFIAVTTTKIYCRPICPARAPNDANVRYFPTAAAAEAAGFRPCLRCRPEASPGTPAWLGTSTLVSRGLRLISEGALDREGVEQLSDRLGVTARHLRRLFVQHLGATPVEVALTRRVHFAKKLLDDTALPFREVAFASGFGSLRRFNAQIRRTYSRTPTDLRRRTQANAGETGCYRFRLTFRPPYDWEAVAAFLAARATPGVEAIDAAGYRRTIAVDGVAGTLEITPAADRPAMEVAVRIADSRPLLFIIERVRRMFDLGADPAVIAEHLAGDAVIGPVLERHPGIRTPGAWDGFELSVRAILGQQISVRAATTIAGRMAAMFGTPVDASGSLNRLFPTAAQLAVAPIEHAGVIHARAEAIRGLARAVSAGDIEFGTRAAGHEAVARLRAVPGIGEWTAQYIVMRALGEPDAFPSGDLILRRMASPDRRPVAGASVGAACTSRELDTMSERWRPWRAYAVMLLWQAATDEADGSRRIRHAPSPATHRLNRARRRDRRAAAGTR
jgi:AraC family transcriptional regulator of adaptative response / DNA-3-methyladenine glycosylase II